MADQFKKVSPGDKFRPNADLHNTVVDMARDYEAGRSLSQQGFGVGGDGRVFIENVSPDPLPWYGVCGIGAFMSPPHINLPEFRRLKAFKSAEPAPGEPFAIVQEPIPARTVGEAILSGVSQVLVEYTVGDGFADAIAGDYDKLLSADAGQAEILRVATPPDTTLDGSIDDVVTTLVVAYAKRFPAVPFVVTIDDEDVNVTATSGTTWAVERGHNGTTAASHADEAVVAFVSGVVWASVRIGSPAGGADFDNLPEILAVNAVFG